VNCGAVDTPATVRTGVVVDWAAWPLPARRVYVVCAARIAPDGSVSPTVGVKLVSVSRMPGKLLRTSKGAALGAAMARTGSMK
jgi:hypothetical protein